MIGVTDVDEDRPGSRPAPLKETRPSLKFSNHQSHHFVGCVFVYVFIKDKGHSPRVNARDEIFFADSGRVRSGRAAVTDAPGNIFQENDEKRSNEEMSGYRQFVENSPGARRALVLTGVLEKRGKLWL